MESPKQLVFRRSQIKGVQIVLLGRLKAFPGGDAAKAAVRWPNLYVFPTVGPTINLQATEYAFQVLCGVDQRFTVVGEWQRD